MTLIVYSRGFSSGVRSRLVAVLGAPNRLTNRMVSASHGNDVRGVDLP